MGTSWKIPLWLDCDPGHDDAVAILLAAYHPNLDLLGISTVYGNASLNKTTNNALAVLEAIGKPSIPVFPGATKPFCRTVEVASDIHGESGLDGTDLLPKPSRKALSHCNTVHEMRDALLSCPQNTAWLVATGALTNIALLVATYPEVADHIKGLSIMGGAVGNGFTSAYVGPPYTDSTGETHARIGNTTPFAEFNIWCDPESAQSLFTNPRLQSKTVVITLDVTHQACVGKEVQDQLKFGGHPERPPTKLRRMFNELLTFFGGTYTDVFGLAKGPPLHDPLAVAAVLHDNEDPAMRIHFEHGSSERWQVQVPLEGQEIGRTVITPTEQGTMIPRGLDINRFWSALEMCMAKADQATGLVI